jgi:hypothetical protein
MNLISSRLLLIEYVGLYMNKNFYILFLAKLPLPAALLYRPKIRFNVVITLLT